MEKVLVGKWMNFTSVTGNEVLDPEYPCKGILFKTEKGSILMRGFSRSEAICLFEYLMHFQGLKFQRTIHNSGWFNCAPDMQKEYSQENINKGESLFKTYFPWEYGVFTRAYRNKQ